MITILINSQKDTDFLRKAYEGLEDNIVLVNPTREKVEKVLAEHPNDTAMLMGHGSPSGLFSHDWRGYIIDSKNANLLQNREVIAIWCWAKEFGRKEGLKGFFTSMFISNIGEYEGHFRNDRTQTHTEEEIFNGITDFVTSVNTYIKIGKPLNEWCEDLRNSADYSKNFVKYNYDGLEYFDGNQDRVVNFLNENESYNDGYTSIDLEMEEEYQLFVEDLSKEEIMASTIDELIERAYKEGFKAGYGSVLDFETIG